MPIFETGINKGRLNRPVAAATWKMTIMEIGKAYNNWIQVFRYSESTLTFHQYLTKMRAVQIGPFDVGVKNGQWQLARDGDAGAYTDGNCRFIPSEANFAAQVQNGKFVLHRDHEPDGKAHVF